MGALYLSKNNQGKSHPASVDFEIPKTAQGNPRVRETQPLRRDYAACQKKKLEGNVTPEIH